MTALSIYSQEKGLSLIESKKTLNLIFDNDTVCNYIEINCTSIYGHHLFEIDSKNDSLYCLLISRYPLENSKKVLTIERNSYGDTLGIGFELEMIEKIKFIEIKKNKSNKNLANYFRIGNWTFSLNKKPLFKRRYLFYYEKIGEWTYFEPNGEVKAKVNYD